MMIIVEFKLLTKWKSALFYNISYSTIRNTWFWMVSIMWLNIVMTAELYIWQYHQTREQKMSKRNSSHDASLSASMTLTHNLKKVALMAWETKSWPTLKDCKSENVSAFNNSCVPIVCGMTMWPGQHTIHKQQQSRLWTLEISQNLF